MINYFFLGTLEAGENWPKLYASLSQRPGSIEVQEFLHIIGWIIQQTGAPVAIMTSPSTVVGTFVTFSKSVTKPHEVTLGKEILAIKDEGADPLIRMLTVLDNLDQSLRINFHFYPMQTFINNESPSLNPQNFARKLLVKPIFIV